MLIGILIAVGISVVAGLIMYVVDPGGSWGEMDDYDDWR